MGGRGVRIPAKTSKLKEESGILSSYQYERLSSFLINHKNLSQIKKARLHRPRSTSDVTAPPLGPQVVPSTAVWPWNLKSISISIFNSELLINQVSVKLVALILTTMLFLFTDPLLKGSAPCVTFRVGVCILRFFALSTNETVPTSNFVLPFKAISRMRFLVCAFGWYSF